jgi:hypothetical protein
MDQDDTPLSEQAQAILQLIAAGRSYDQILLRYPNLAYQDIFAAAQEALTKLRPVPQLEAMPQPPQRSEPAIRQSPMPAADVIESDAPTKSLPGYIERARRTHRRAYERWTSDEDVQLERLFRRGAHLAEIGQALGRHNGAIRSRLTKLGLIDDTEDAPDILLKPADAPSLPDASASAPPPRASFEWEGIRRRLEGGGPDRD